MKTTRLNEFALQLTRLGFVNCYLVRESDGFTLIDTGLPGGADDILATAASAGLPIRRIVLTHAHGDHVGSLDALAAKLGGVSAAATERSLPLLRTPPDTTLAPGEAPGKIRGGLPGVKTVVTHLLADGELYGSLRVIATPGHIPGHIALLDERDGTLYAGDALIAISRLFVSGYGKGLLSLFNNFNWSRETSIQSARRLLDYPVERFACGHGEVREGGLPTLRAALDATGGR